MEQFQPSLKCCIFCSIIIHNKKNCAFLKTFRLTDVTYSLTYLYIVLLYTALYCSETLQKKVMPDINKA